MVDAIQVMSRRAGGDGAAADRISLIVPLHFASQEEGLSSLPMSNLYFKGSRVREGTRYRKQEELHSCPPICISLIL